MGKRMKVGDFIIAKHDVNMIYKVIKIYNNYEYTKEIVIEINKIVDPWKRCHKFWIKDFRLATPEEISATIAKRMLA